MAIGFSESENTKTLRGIDWGVRVRSRSSVGGSIVYICIKCKWYFRPLEWRKKLSADGEISADNERGLMDVLSGVWGDFSVTSAYSCLNSSCSTNRREQRKRRGEALAEALRGAEGKTANYQIIMSNKKVTSSIRWSLVLGHWSLRFGRDIAGWSVMRRIADVGGNAVCGASHGCAAPAFGRGEFWRNGGVDAAERWCYTRGTLSCDGEYCVRNHFPGATTLPWKNLWFRS